MTFKSGILVILGVIGGLIVQVLGKLEILSSIKDHRNKKVRKQGGRLHLQIY